MGGVRVAKRGVDPHAVLKRGRRIYMTGESVEGEGIGRMRRRLRECDGTLEIQTKPEFQLIVTIERGALR